MRRSGRLVALPPTASRRPSKRFSTRRPRSMLNKAIALCFVLASAAGVAAQGTMGGASTGTARTYSSVRTAGVVDPKAPVVFEDLTARTALAGFLQVGGGKA